MDAVILGGGQDGRLAPEAALLDLRPEGGPGPGNDEGRHAAGAGVELGPLAPHLVLVTLVREYLVIGAVQEVRNTSEGVSDHSAGSDCSPAQEAGHQEGVAGVWRALGVEHSAQK